MAKFGELRHFGARCLEVVVAAYLLEILASCPVPTRRPLSASGVFENSTAAFVGGELGFPFPSREEKNRQSQSKSSHMFCGQQRVSSVPLVITAPDALSMCPISLYRVQLYAVCRCVALAVARAESPSLWIRRGA